MTSARGRSDCPSCGSTDLRAFHEQLANPVNSCLLLDSRSEATGFPRADLVLALCRSCGFIFNAVFDQSMSEYSARYEETQGFSPRFVEFAKSLAVRWITRYDLRDRDILEIGCGKGEFLQLLCELGPNRGVGIDPSYHPERMNSAAGSRMRFIQDFYSEEYAHLTADAVVCRHTLEHIAPVGDFMRLVRRTITDPSTIVLFELPDVYRVLREIAFWDIYYEHCSYFTLGSLARLFRDTGLDVISLELDYDDQYLLVAARPGSGSGTPALTEEQDLDAVTKAVDYFEDNYPRRIQEWRQDLEDIMTSGKRAVIWGAGSKGVSYLTTLGIVDEIRYAVDINPYKHGKFMAGTGQEIVSPEFLQTYRPDEVLVMNGVYLDEIETSLRALGVDANVRAV